MRDRGASERIRYVCYHGIDLRERSIDDLVVQTTEIAPNDVVAKMLEATETATPP